MRMDSIRIGSLLGSPATAGSQNLVESDGFRFNCNLTGSYGHWPARTQLGHDCNVPVLVDRGDLVAGSSEEQIRPRPEVEG